MNLVRRNLLMLPAALAGAGIAHAAPPVRSTPVSAFGIDASHLGARPGSPDDQSPALQRAIDQAAAAGAPLAFPPGVYRAGGLKLPDGAHLVGPGGSARLVLTAGPALLSAENVDRVTLTGLVFDGAKRRLPERRGLVHAENAARLTIRDCDIVGSGGNGIFFVAVAGEVSGTTIAEAADVALLSFNARGLLIARNTIRAAGNNGIQLLRWENGDDGTMVVDNRIDGVTNRAGGSGQFGNGINAHRAGNVIVRGNRISNCAFSGVRGNTASNITIIGNSISQMGETAIYSEFAFEGAVIADNVVDGAQTGISVCNFNEGGRIAAVQGNIVRNLARRESNPSPDGFNGLGIYVEADTTVSGNVVENASAAGLVLGWGPYLRDVAASGNVVRQSGIGIAVSVVPGARAALIANNVISGSRLGTIVGMDHARPVTGDLTPESAARYPHLTLQANRAG